MILVKLIDMYTSGPGPHILYLHVGDSDKGDRVKKSQNFCRRHVYMAPNVGVSDAQTDEAPSSAMYGYRAT